MTDKKRETGFPFVIDGFYRELKTGKCLHIITCVRHLLEKPTFAIDSKGNPHRLNKFHTPDDYLKISEEAFIVGGEEKKTDESDYGVEFETGKCYEHRSGGRLRVIGKMKKHLSDEELLVGSTLSGDIFIIEDSTTERNYRELSEEEFMKGRAAKHEEAREFGRQELIDLKFRALELASVTPNVSWRRAYESLAEKADHADAMIARSIDGE